MGARGQRHEGSTGEWAPWGRKTGSMEARCGRGAGGTEPGEGAGPAAWQSGDLETGKAGERMGWKRLGVRVWH